MPSPPLAALLLAAALLAQGCGPFRADVPARNDPSSLAKAIRDGGGAERAAVLDYMGGSGFPRELLAESPLLLDAVGGLTVGADKALALQAVLLLSMAPRSDGIAAILSCVASGADPVLAYHASAALGRRPGP